MRVVLDTNIIVSAFHFRGSVREVIHIIKAQHDTWIVSPFILEETNYVLASKFQWGSSERQSLLAWIDVHSELVTPLALPNTIQADPSDNHILAAASAGLAQIIVSGDTKHLLPLKRWEGILVISASEFLELR